MISILNEFRAEVNGKTYIFCTGICPVCNIEFSRRKSNFVKAKCCGCKPNHLRHGMTRTRPYYAWRNMLMRCLVPTTKFYALYGGRGIKVCERWKTFENFWQDMKVGYSAHLTLDRLDTNGNYEPSNCRWATSKEQSLNRRNSIVFNGESAHEAGIRINRNPSLVYQRLNAGWDKETAFTKPSRRPR
jgi:YHS domain-containing protein